MEPMTTATAVVIGVKTLAGTKGAAMAHTALTCYKASKAVGITKAAYLQHMQMQQSAQLQQAILQIAQQQTQQFLS